MVRTLTHQEAKAYYDAAGTFQDKQGWYENPPLALLRRHGKFDQAQSVVEFGCGTGRFAQNLLDGALPTTAHYLGFDISTEMIAIAMPRLAPYSPRAQVKVTSGAIELAVPDGTQDRVIACFVLDLLSPDDSARFVAEAHRVLAPGGMLYLAGLTPGHGPISRLISRIWSTVHRLRPKLVGGCRPITMKTLFSDMDWDIMVREVVSPYGLSSEVIVAKKVSVQSARPTAAAPLMKICH